MAARSRVVVALLGLGAGLPTTTAHATESAAIAPDAAMLERALAAQYKEALLRARRDADDQMLPLVDAPAATMKAARVALDHAKGSRDLRQRQAALEASRGAYLQAVERIAMPSAEEEAALAAWTTSTQTLVATASPEASAALQRFADGDRAGAWPALAALCTDIARPPTAIPRETAAANLRALALLRALMHLRGEATANDVLLVWDQAARLEPQDVQTRLAQSRLEVELGDLLRAEGAAKEAVAAATGGPAWHLALGELGKVALARRNFKAAELAFGKAAEDRRGAWSQGDPAAGRDLVGDLRGLGDVLFAQHNLDRGCSQYTEALNIAQTLRQQDPASPAVAALVADVLLNVGTCREAREDLPGALRDYTESLTLSQALRDQDPFSAARKAEVSRSLNKASSALAAQDDLPGDQRLHEAEKARVEALYKQYPASTALARDLANSIIMVGASRLVQGEPSDGVQFYTAGLQVLQAHRLQDPNSAPLARDISRVLLHLGDIYILELRDDRSAQQCYEEALAVLTTLQAQAPSSGELARDIWKTLANLSELPGSDVSWSQIHKAFVAYDKVGPATPEDRHLQQLIHDRLVPTP